MTYWSAKMERLCKHCDESEEASIHDRHFCGGHYCEFEAEDGTA
jgi:hypothetical protein